MLEKANLLLQLFDPPRERLHAPLVLFQLELLGKFLRALYFLSLPHWVHSSFFYAEYQVRINSE